MIMTYAILSHMIDNLLYDLKRHIVPSDVLLDRLRVFNEEDRLTSAYTDPKHAPFYYYLGKRIKPKRIAEINFGLGFFTCCFLKGCSTVEDVLLFQETTPNNDYKLGIKNVQDVFGKKPKFYVGKPLDKEFESLFKGSWDAIFINGRNSYDWHLSMMETAWQRLNLDGYLVVAEAIVHENAAKAYSNFCTIHNKERLILPTKYGTGLIRK